MQLRTEFFIKWAQFFIKMGVNYKYGSTEVAKNRDP